MLELGLFDDISAVSSQVIILTFDKECHSYAFAKANDLRNAGIETEVYPSPVKMKKQMKYANSKGIPNVIIIGDEEMKSGRLTLKDMESGKSDQYSIKEIIEKLGTK
ncbi:MAG: His/Gly/Thr/Pro-type tRNA ligase C-terminal domain-containing protein, partial [Saprospiraceae bacterium]|nr:His/Gly/Thr/Pro-type tRNA ligase C-terminal domain-containing protein [Saprospiraceae bacterium]